MNKSINQCFFAFIFSSLILSLSTSVAFGLEYENLPDIKDGIVSINTQEPERAVGYTVGDILTRSITLNIKKPYQLIDESLPIIGYERRYKGQLVGIDLSNIKHIKKDEGDSVKHELSLSYQARYSNPRL